MDSWRRIEPVLTPVLVGYGLRADGATLGCWELRGPAAIRVGSAYVLLMLALGQRSPGSTVSWACWIGLPILAIVLQVGGAYWTFVSAGPPPNVRWLDEAMCFDRIALLGLPPVLSTCGCPRADSHCAPESSA